MSILQFFFGIMNIKNNIVNHIDLYENCPPYMSPKFRRFSERFYFSIWERGLERHL